jgi:C-terminal processing protease CtpA/Prc
MRRWLLASLTPLLLSGACSARDRDRRDGRLLSELGQQNLVAFTKLLGYVRFFYPGDEAANTDWNQFAVRAIPRVEAAANADSLAQALREVFSQVAPAVLVYRAGATPIASTPTAAKPRLVFWVHVGLGGGVNSRIYMSRRLVVGAGLAGSLVPFTYPFGSDSVPVPSPDHPLTVDLEGGVSATVPVALPTDESAVRDSALWAAPQRDSTDTPDRATRLAVASTVWIIAQHFYPYFDVSHSNWDSVLVPTLQMAATTSDPDSFRLAMERMVAVLHDGHGQFYSARDQAQHRWFGHPPVSLAIVEGRMIVTGVEDAAVAAGVQVGDEVLTVDGRPALQILKEEELRTSAATAGRLEYVALRQLLVGSPGTGFSLRIRNSMDSLAPARVVQLARSSGPTAYQAPHDMIADLGSGVLYIDFGRVTTRDLNAGAMPQRLRSATGIVFDLRGYPRRVETYPILAMLSARPLQVPPFDVPLVTQPDHRFVRFVHSVQSLRPYPVQIRPRVVFLTGPDAVSYGESTLGIVECNGLGPMVGSPTAGTDGNMNWIPIPGGFAFRFTGMKVTKCDGSTLQGVGFRPNVSVEPTLRGVREGRDEVLERALPLVSGHRH